MNVLEIDGKEYVLRCDLNVIDQIESKFLSVDNCKSLAASGAVGSAAAVKFLAAAMINEHFAATGNKERVTENYIGQYLGGEIAKVLTPIFQELTDCYTTSVK